MTRHMEMDDWNRTRSWTEIHCDPCRVKLAQQEQRERERSSRKAALNETAKRLAEERYLTQWLERFRGLSKKKAWLLYTGGAGYPSLGTFYKQVRDIGIEQYLRHLFSCHFEKALKQMGVSDPEIVELLEERERI